MNTTETLVPLPLPLPLPLPEKIAKLGPIPCASGSGILG